MAGEVVLIIEDNERNMKLARDVLTFRGYRVLEAPTAERGLELATSDHPDLVLMDIQLPGMGGIEALGHLRANPATARIRVVAFTASAMKDDRERILAAGFDGYIVKPISVREFPGQVQEQLDLRCRST